QGKEIDDPVIVLSPDASFADINLHGGAWIMRAIFKLAERAGFEAVERAEMPLPDDAIDATDEIEREIAAYLPLATTELALRMLLAQQAAWRSLTAQFREGQGSREAGRGGPAEPARSARQEPRPPTRDPIH